MKLKKILVITLVIVSLICCFSISTSAAYYSYLDDDGWNNILMVDTLTCSFPGVFRTYEDASFPFWTFLNATNTSTFSGSLSFGGRNVDTGLLESNIWIPENQGLEFSLLFRYAEDGVLLPLSNVVGLMTCYIPSTGSTMESAIDKEFDVVLDDTGKYWKLTLQFRNVFGTDLLVNSVAVLYQGFAIKDRRYDMEIQDVKFRYLSEDYFLTNGWDPDPTVPEGQEKVDELTDLENKVEESTQGDVDAAIGAMNNFSNDILTFTGGLAFIVGIFNLFFRLDWLTSLISIGLTLGIIGFLLNLAPSVGGRLRRDEIDKKIEARRQSYSRKRGG